MMQNDHIILVSGKSKTGKSSSLESLKDDAGVIFLIVKMVKNYHININFLLNIT